MLAGEIREHSELLSKTVVVKLIFDEFLAIYLPDLPFLLIKSDY